MTVKALTMYDKVIIYSIQHDFHIETTLHLELICKGARICQTQKTK